MRLDQLGTVSDGAAEARGFARQDGRPIVAFAVCRSTGASDVVAADAVEAEIAALDAADPNLTLSLVDDSTTYTRGSFASAMETLVEGAVLAVIVVLVFLCNWRATAIAAVALPLSIIPTFFVMNALGFSLNTVSLLAVTLVTAILVDDAIVEIENIVRHMRMGSPPYRAAMEAASEIGTAVIAVSFAIVAVFAPVSFMSGIAGRYFRQFGLTVAIAVLFSLAVARLVTPMMAASLLRDRAAAEEGPGRMVRAYTRLLSGTLRFRWLALALGLAIFAASLCSATLLPKAFIPSEDEGRSILSVELPPGSTLDDTARVSDDVAQRIRALGPVRDVFVQGGAAPDGEAADVAATLTINDLPKDERDLSQQDLGTRIDALLREVPDIRFHFVSGGGGRDVSVGVLGSDPDAVARAADALEAQMAALPALRNLTSSASLERPEVQIRPDADLASQLGITTQALSNTLRVATIGDVEENLPKFDAGERQIPILAQLDPAARADLDTLANLRVTTADGSTVPLGSVAEIGLGRGPGQIERYDRQRRISVEADLAPGHELGPAVDAINALPAATDLPPGVSFAQTGDAEIMGEVFSSFGQAMGRG